MAGVLVDWLGLELSEPRTTYTTGISRDAHMRGPSQDL